MTLRPIETHDYAAIVTPRSLGRPPKLEWLAIADLVVDPEYQREITYVGRKNIRRIAGSFDWAMFTPVVVAPAGSGKFAIVDGQHRTTAAKLCGLDRVPCLIVDADRVLQAKAFATINRNVTRVQSVHLYHAALAAGAPEALRVADICKRAGLTVVRNPTALNDLKPGEISFASALGKTVARFGDEISILALRAVAASGSLLTSVIAWGVIEVLNDHREWCVDETALRGALEMIDLDEMLRLARSKAAQLKGTSATDQFEALLVEALAIRLKPKRRA
jgi:hypothetical protein